VIRLVSPFPCRQARDHRWVVCSVVVYTVRRPINPQVFRSTRGGPCSRYAASRRDVRRAYSLGGMQPADNPIHLQYTLRSCCQRGSSFNRGRRLGAADRASRHPVGCSSRQSIGSIGARRTCAVQTVVVAACSQLSVVATRGPSGQQLVGRRPSVRRRARPLSEKIIFLVPTGYGRSAAAR